MNDHLFQDLLASIKEMKAIEKGTAKPARKTVLTRNRVTNLRQRLGISQPKFAQMMGISVRTLQNWEQGHREPTGPAMVLLQVAEKRPDAVLESIVAE